jgi:hypothetical protein
MPLGRLCGGDPRTSRFVLRHDRSPIELQITGNKKARPLSRVGLGVALAPTFALREQGRKGQMAQVMRLVCLGVYFDVQAEISLAVMSNATIFP